MQLSRSFSTAFVKLRRFITGYIYEDKFLRGAVYADAVILTGSVGDSCLFRTIFNSSSLDQALPRLCNLPAK